MKKADFKVGDYVCALNVTNKVLTISEIEYFKDSDDYVYYTLDGQSFGGLQIEPMELVFDKKYKMTTEKLIEEILIEVSAYGLREEVIQLAKRFMEEGYDKLNAYELAYREWVK